MNGGYSDLANLETGACISVSKAPQRSPNRVTDRW